MKKATHAIPIIPANGHGDALAGRSAGRGWLTR
jgi:hypothetical protein